MGAEVLGVCAHGEGLVHARGPLLGDHVGHVHRPDGGEGEVGAAHELHGHGEADDEEVGRGQVVAEAQTGRIRVRGEVGEVNGDTAHLDARLRVLVGHVLGAADGRHTDDDFLHHLAEVRDGAEDLETGGVLCFAHVVTLPGCSGRRRGRCCR